MADDPTPTPNSDPTPNPAPSDPPAAKPQDDPKPADAPAADEPKKGDDLGTTALGGGDDPRADDPKADDAAKAEVPESYELKVPEGFDGLDPKAVEAATPVFKKLGLTNEQANELMPVAGEFAKSIIAERDKQFMGTIMEQRANWLNDAKADKEIGGSNWDGSLQAAARAFDLLGFPKGSPLRAALDESGFGNHPEMIRFAAKVGKAIGEDSDFVRGDTNASVKPKEAKDVFWPGQSPQKG